MTFELTEKEMKFVHTALLRLNYVYEDMSACAYVKGRKEAGSKMRERADEVWALYKKLSENER